MHCSDEKGVATPKAVSVGAAGTQCTGDAGNGGADGTIAFVLREEDTTTGNLEKLEKPFIRTSARATILHLQKFLQKKIALTSPDDVEILCQGQLMESAHTLEFVDKNFWHHRHKQLELVYRGKVHL